MPIRSQMSLFMDQIEAEHLKLFAPEFRKIAESHYFHPRIYKCKLLCTKHGHNICDTEIFDEFD